MNKRIVMYLIYMVAVILLLVFRLEMYINDCLNSITEDKVCVVIKLEDRISKESFVDYMQSLTEEYSMEVLYMRADNGKGFTYYTTGMNSDDKRHSSNPAQGDIRLTGIYPHDFDINITAFQNISNDSRISNISGEYYIDVENAELFLQILKDDNIDAEIISYTNSENVDAYILMAFIASSVFLIITAIFYIFSRTKEFALAKASGYSISENAKNEISKHVVPVMSITVTVIVLMWIYLSIAYNIKSGIIFLVKNIICFIVMAVFVFLTLFIASLYAYNISGLYEIKGEMHNDKLFKFALLSKTVTILMLVMITVIAVDNSIQLFRKYSITQKHIDILHSYAVTSIYGGLAVYENDDELMNKAAAILDMYNLLDENMGLIECNLQYIDMMIYATDSGNIKRGSVNRNYLDASDEIYTIEGKRLDSSCLEEGKVNILIPEKFFAENMPGSYLTDIQDESMINYIKYSKDSRFFTFSNETELINNGYVNDAIIEIFDPNLMYKYGRIDIAAYNTLAAFFEKAFIKYDSRNSRSMEEQIYHYVYEAGLSEDIFVVRHADDVFYEGLIIDRWNLMWNIAGVIALFICYVIVCISSSSLYYERRRKSISVKLLEGAGFADVFKDLIFINIMISLLIIPSALFITDEVELQYSVGTVVSAVYIILNLFLTIGVITQIYRKNIIAAVKDG